MAKMTDVAPETFIQGLGVYSDDVDDALYGIGWLGMSEEDALFNVSGLGTLALGKAVTSAAWTGAVAALKFKAMNDNALLDYIKRNPKDAAAKAEFARRKKLPAPKPAAKPISVMDAIVKNASEMNKKLATIKNVRQAVAAKDPAFAVKLAAAQKKTSAPGSNIVRAVQQASNEAAKKALMAKQQESQAKKLLAQSDKRGAAAKAVAALTTARDAAILANKAEKTRITTGLDVLKNTLKSQADYLTQQAKIESARTGPSPRTMALTATAASVTKAAQGLAAQSATVAAMPTVPANAPSQQRIADLANRFNIRTARGNKQSMSRAVAAVLGDLAENPMAQVNDYEGALSYYGVDGLGQLMADIEFDNYEAAFAGLASGMGSIGYTDTTPTLAESDEILRAATKLAQDTYQSVILPSAGLNGLSFNFDDINKAFNSVKDAVGGAINTVKQVTSTVKTAAQKITSVVGGTKPKPPPVQTKPPVTVAVPTVSQSIQQAATNLATQTQQAATAAYDTAKGVAGKIPMWAYAVGGVAVLGAGYMLFLKPKSSMA